MERDFEGRHVVVTGGAGALGSAVVDALLARGATCHVPTEEPPGGSRLIERDDGRLVVVPSIDLRDETSVTRFYEGLPALWASVHCAGGFSMTPIADTTLASWDHLLSMNATTTFLCTREAVRAMRRTSPEMPAEGRGRVVMVAAQTTLDARRGAGMAAYAASKAAVGALAVALAEELAAEGIFVNAIAPSILDTRANRAAMPDADHASWAKLEDVARTIAFLASPTNRVARGGVLPVFGRA